MNTTPAPVLSVGQLLRDTSEPDSDDLFNVTHNPNSELACDFCDARPVLLLTTAGDSPTHGAICLNCADLTQLVAV